ncbi:MAG: hypothetical protein ACLQGP_34965 [Isosphaeraceae bacterium]
MPIRKRTELSWEERDDRADLIGPGMGIGFVRAGDRWTHALSIPEEGGVEVARVVESQPDRDDPARIVSPVFQELQKHEPRDGMSLCLLMTGLWFDHHFSAAVSLAPDPERVDDLTLEFDVADRCRSPIESLAATYVMRLGSGALAEASPDRITWSLDGPSPGSLELVADSPSSLVMAEAGRQAMRVQVLASILPGHFTHRLRYRWRWTSSAPLTR